jgi:hypothetical protein
LIDELTSKGPDSISLKDARSLKTGVGDQVTWNRLPGTDIPVTEQFHRGLYGELKSGEEKIAQALAESGQIPNADAFLNAKKTYGNLSAAEAIAEKAAANDLQTNFWV